MSDTPNDAAPMAAAVSEAAPVPAPELEVLDGGAETPETPPEAQAPEPDDAWLQDLRAQWQAPLEPDNQPAPADADATEAAPWLVDGRVDFGIDGLRKELEALIEEGEMSGADRALMETMSRIGDAISRVVQWIEGANMEIQYAAVQRSDQHRRFFEGEAEAAAATLSEDLGARITMQDVAGAMAPFWEAMLDRYGQITRKEMVQAFLAHVPRERYATGAVVHGSAAAHGRKAPQMPGSGKTRPNAAPKTSTERIMAAMQTGKVISPW